MKKNQTIRFALFALVLALAGIAQVYTIQANRITLGQPLAGSGIYVVQAYFPGGYGAFAFDSSKSLQAFVRLPQVDIEPVAERIKIEEAGL